MTVIKHANQRVGVFIDTQNLYHSAKNLYKAKVDFGAILKESVAGRQLIRARAYVVTTESGDETNFFEALEKLGIEIKTKDLQIFFGGAKKADWDVGLAVDAITAAPKLDAVVLATGDGDFIPLAQYLQHHSGCQVEVISFGKSLSLIPSNPPWIFGCRVFTLPSKISGKFVISETLTTSTPLSASNRAVPPVEIISTPVFASFFAKSATPDLSDTDINARFIFVMIIFVYLFCL